MNEYFIHETILVFYSALGFNYFLKLWFEYGKLNITCNKIYYFSVFKI